jgi:hypothetical protein
MISAGDVDENGVLEIVASGKLTVDDYSQVRPGLEVALEQHGCLKFLVELRDFEGFEAGALWEDIRFDIKYRDQIGRTAIVGDNKWEEIGTRISKLFFSSELRFFYDDQKEAALNWINEVD